MQTDPCPKCTYLRQPTDHNPAWQCPSCGIAYHKYQSYLDKARHIARSREASMVQEPLVDDGSLWSLVLTNLFVLGMALVFHWTLIDMLVVYWTQSVIIGLSYCARILSLEKFSTENFKMNGRHVEPTTATKIQVGLFFLVHYGIFHLVYAVFIWTGELGEPAPLNWEYLLCTGAFALNHFYSWRYHCRMDRNGTPNIGTLMFTPYIRIVPMHLIILFGTLIGQYVGLFAFGIMKTIADAGMHRVEHQKLSHRQEQP